MLLYLANRKDYQVIKGVEELQLHYIKEGPLYRVLK